MALGVTAARAQRPDCVFCRIAQGEERPQDLVSSSGSSPDEPSGAANSTGAVPSTKGAGGRLLYKVRAARVGSAPPVPQAAPRGGAPEACRRAVANVAPERDLRVERGLRSGRQSDGLSGPQACSAAPLSGACTDQVQPGSGTAAAQCALFSDARALEKQAIGLRRC